MRLIGASLNGLARAIFWIRSGWRYALASISVGAIAVTFWLQPAATFVIHARTEILRIRVGANQSRWYLNEARISRTPDSESVFHQVSLQIDQGTFATMERVGPGPVQVALDRQDSTEVGSLYASNGQFISRLPSGAILSFTPEQTPSMADSGVFPVLGSVWLGSRLASMSEPTLALLREGRIQIVSRALFTNTPFDAGTTDLFDGDFVEVPDDSEPGSGLVRVNEAAGLGVIIQSTARFVNVNRFMGMTVPVRLSPLLRLQKDTTLQSLWAAVAACWGLWKLVAVKEREA